MWAPLTDTATHGPRITADALFWGYSKTAPEMHEVNDAMMAAITTNIISLDHDVVYPTKFVRIGEATASWALAWPYQCMFAALRCI